MLKKRKILIVIIIVGIIITGIVSVKKINQRKSLIVAEENDLGIPTAIMEVATGELRDEISYVGIIESKNAVAISPKITSEVSQLKFKEGDFVSKGNVIASLNDKQLSAKVDTTMHKKETLQVNRNYLNKEINNYYEKNPLVKKIEALQSNYDFLSTQVEKQKVLYENGAIPKNSYDEVVHEQEVMAIQLKELKATSENSYNKLIHEENMVTTQIKEIDALTNELNLNVQETVITAPISGRIRLINYNEGDLAMMGKPLAIIDDLDNLIVKVNVGEVDLAKLKLGTSAIIESDLNKYHIEGNITNILPSVNPLTKLGEVEVSFSLKDKKDLKMGASKKVRFILNEDLKEEILIESAFIKELQNKKIVYVEKDGIVFEKEIKTGLKVGDKVEVLEGLKKGDKIAYKNITTLYDGAKIFVYQGVGNL
ncbi:RND family efflux transporter, MFP subunit [Desulfonispora thiosulfatigenes DSM 11270]|uniref:RND family efflux transporter, MFP subunit n=1 Tax=Desulfonispora thiosulfatigenes DSM 11270 TaxID=656914 RepID=A0A1W1UD37_DESTI|nr:efflux RND transporter periplasmic adaptor subunit [Desulfonispora thiosulfatigenes]SMB79016.1 RND family efflux transporter, MFP subunit [Desulfonispora thiosulfatigenes DSM 11270]